MKLSFFKAAAIASLASVVDLARLLKPAATAKSIASTS